MRALRLMIDGFGSYRERTEIDFSDVSFFALTGPTGSGKSTVIDALCFALYGTVPRWGKGNAIKNALAPSTSECRVCLVFEAAGARYAAVRLLRRTATGNVQTKEARLDRLDDAVPPDADLVTLLETNPQPLAEGPDKVVAEVTELLGIGYEHFTQCVLLPQGRFAEFLHAKPGDRQDLLIQLLAYSVYEQVGVRARERGKLAAQRLALAEERLAGLGAVDSAEVSAAEARVAALDALVPQVDSAVTAMAELRERWTEANRRVLEARAALEPLAALRMPDGLADLAARLASASELVARRVAEREAAESAEASAERALDGLPDRELLVRLREALSRSVALERDLASRRSALDSAVAAEASSASSLAAADDAVGEAEAAVAVAEREHSAAALAAHLRPGAPCPVCRRAVDSVPSSEVPADLDRARAALASARTAASTARDQHGRAGRVVAAARTAVEEAERRLDEVRSVVDSAAASRSADGSPSGGPATGVVSLEKVEEALAVREAADRAVDRARADARAARAAETAAGRERDGLRDAEQRAWAELRAGRDRVVALDAPAVDGDDLRTAWNTLLDWAASKRTALATDVEELTAAEAALRAEGVAAASSLVELLADNGIAGLTPSDAARAPVELATQRERAARVLADLRERAERSAELADEVARHREERQVADLLGNLLRSDGFERWLCAEALDSLVTEASATLLQLSGGQYELFRGARNELTVIDHNDAGTQRPVHTLSGGETFQASLALALALSRQVVGLSGGRRDLNSMFLDEGFGTLDESTLDTVASTLERLAEESDCMVGIVTHVPALAERVPVQFAVTRDGASSHLRRVQV